MANGVVSSLTFLSPVAGQSVIQGQPIGGNLILQLPNQLPAQNQLMSVSTVVGNVVTLGWSNPQSLSNIPLTALSTSGASSGDVIQFNGTSWAVSAFVPGSGTVTSVALTAPAEFSVGGSPITGSGTLAITKANQSANTVWAGPTTGAAAAPTFRALVAADIPSLPYDATGAAAAVAAQLPSSQSAVLHQFLKSYAAGTPGTFTTAQPDFADLSGSLAVAQINSKVGNGNAVQLSNTGQTIVAGDVLTYDANGNVQDSGTLLSSLASNASVALKANIASPTFTGIVTAGHVQAASGGLLVDATGTDGVRIADNGNARGILVGGTTAGAGHIWLWSPGGTTLVDVSDTGVAISGATSFTSANPTFFSAQGNGSKVQLSTGTTTTGDVVTYDANGNTVDSGTLLTSLAPKASPTLTGTTTIGRLKSVDPDTAGELTITGTTTATVTFAASYTGTNPPVVVVTPQMSISGNGPWVTYTGSAGAWTAFTVNFQNAQTGTLNYMVIDIG